VRGLSYALVDVDTGQVLSQNGGDRQLSIASTTKIMTGLIAVERCSLAEIVTVPAEAASVHGSRIYLEPGETYRVEELLYAMMIASANDAAVALAHHISGSVEAFSALMNQRAREIGLEGLSFKNPHGLDQEGHLGTATDLARLGAVALKNPLFRRFSSATQATISWPVKDSVREINSHNYFLVSYPGATGMKTGWTDLSGHCLVGSAARGGREVVGVVLGAEDRDQLWRDMSSLISYGLDEFEAVETVSAGARFDLALETGMPGLLAETQLPVRTVRPVGGAFAAGSRVGLAINRLELPIGQGDVVGYLEVFEGDRMVGSSPLVSIVPVPAAGAGVALWKQGGLILLAGGALAGIYRWGRRRRRLRRVLVRRYAPLTTSGWRPSIPARRGRPRALRQKRHWNLYIRE
jgi:D-alanyl-D-alanine carboxypeptidase